MWYAKARYYNPDLGRFAAEDPIKGNILDLQSLNLYPYVKNNPLKYIDPDGRRHETIQAEAEAWTGCGSTLMEAAKLSQKSFDGSSKGWNKRKRMGEKEVNND